MALLLLSLAAELLPPPPLLPMVEAAAKKPPLPKLQLVGEIMVGTGRQQWGVGPRSDGYRACV